MTCYIHSVDPDSILGVGSSNWGWPIRHKITNSWNSNKVNVFRRHIQLCHHRQGKRSNKGTKWHPLHTVTPQPVIPWVICDIYIGEIVTSQSFRTVRLWSQNHADVLHGLHGLRSKTNHICTLTLGKTTIYCLCTVLVINVLLSVAPEALIIAHLTGKERLGLDIFRWILEICHITTWSSCILEF